MHILCQMLTIIVSVPIDYIFVIFGCTFIMLCCSAMSACVSIPVCIFLSVPVDDFLSFLSKQLSKMEKLLGTSMYACMKCVWHLRYYRKRYWRADDKTLCIVTVS